MVAMISTEFDHVATGESVGAIDDGRRGAGNGGSVGATPSGRVPLPRSSSAIPFVHPTANVSLPIELVGE